MKEAAAAAGNASFEKKIKDKKTALRFFFIIINYIVNSHDQYLETISPIKTNYNFINFFFPNVFYESRYTYLSNL